MKKSAVLYIAVAALFSGVSVFISNLKTESVQPQSDHQFLFSVFENKLYILPTMALISAFIPLIGQYILVPKQIKHDLRKKILSIMMSNVFNNNQNIRITIFKDVWWIKVFAFYIKSNLRHPTLWYKGKSKYPYPRYGKYIRASERIGTENPKSKVYFYYSLKTQSECEGVAAVARQKKGEQKAFRLPNINHIDFINIHSLENSEHKVVIGEYMRKSFINNFKTLKRLHIKARHFYAHVLVDSNAKTVAVLVVDCNGATSPFDEIVLSKISGYVDLFSSAF